MAAGEHLWMAQGKHKGGGRQLGEVFVMGNGFQGAGLPHYVLIAPIHRRQATLPMVETKNCLVRTEVAGFNYSTRPQIPSGKLHVTRLLRVPNGQVDPIRLNRIQLRMAGEEYGSRDIL